MNKVGVIVAVVVTLFLTFQYVAVKPFLVANEIQAAVDANDSAALAEYVDFLSVRESLKTQLTQRLNDNLQVDATQAHNPLLKLGATLVNSVLDSLLDVYVTPEGLTALMAGREPDGTSPEGADQPYTDVQGGYQSINQFLVEMSNEEGKAITFMLGRRGLGWQITDILLPPTK